MALAAQHTATTPATNLMTSPPHIPSADKMDISMCPVHNGSAAATTTPPPSHIPPSGHAAMLGMDPKDMDISMCPVHNGNAKSAEAFTAMAQYQREQAEQQAKLQREKRMEQERAQRHVASSKFLEGAPRFPAAKMPVETDDGGVVGDIFPDSKPIFGQRFHLSTSPAQSNIPKSSRSKALPQLQLPENVPQVPENLKNVAQQVQAPGSTPVCTSDEAADIAIIDGKEVRLPGKDFNEDTWTFPSHQRFYNAMKKKGWNAAEIDIPYIVSIHNTINQQAWSKIMQWERYHSKDCETPALMKFQGRPQDLSPKARILSTIGYNPPFDRHDWTIDRCGTDVRYVIDFYDGPQSSADPSQGQVSTHLDVRPALDTPSAVWDRIRGAFESMFEMKRLDGMDIRSQQQQQEDRIRQQQATIQQQQQQIHANQQQIHQQQQQIHQQLQQPSRNDH